jgi:hypothetical protein
VSIIGIILIRYVNKNVTKRRLTVGAFIFMIIMAPIAFRFGIYGQINSMRYKNGPKPVPKNLRKFLKNNVVLDENNKTVSIDEYNCTHHTTYTIEDVYVKT